ncbi:hypothetical protein B566_EDAN009780 [Ephemera danica]|nr:hypothetical protein B566_EDAN009780 [Ephemera danica]
MAKNPCTGKDPFPLGLKNWLSITKKPSLVAKEQAAADKCENLLNEISYCYKEGYSNAVRKTVRISDLL